MTKVVSAILSGPIGLIDKKLGQTISGIGLTVIGIVTGNPLLVSAGTFQLGQAFAPPVPKPEQTETALKTPIPPRVSGYGEQRLYLAYALYVTADDGTAVDVGAFHEGRIDSILGHYLGDKKVTLTSGGFVNGLDDGQFGDSDDNVQIGTTLGPATNVAFAPVIAKVPAVWTSAHRGDGVVTGFALWKAVKAKNYQKIYSGGGPNNMPLSLAMRLQPVFDWRDSTQSIGDPLTWKWSANAILHLAHYLLVRDNKDWTKQFVPTLAYWTAAANVCDEAVPLKAGGTEARYRGCVVHKHTDEHKSVVAALLACCDGWMSPRADGALVVYAGRYTAPTVTVDGRDIISYSVQDGIEEENAVNTIPLTYVSDLHDYTTVDTDAWTDEDDIEQRGKELASGGLANQVPSHSQARRLGKRAYAEAMAPKRGTATLRSTGRKILGQRYITLKLDDLGLTLAVQVKPPVKRDPITGQISFAWILADPNVDAWNPATEEGNPAPVGNVVASEPLDPPIVVSVTPIYGQNTAYNTPGVKLTIVATGPARADLTWYVRTRPVDGAAWLEQEYSDTDPGASVTLQTDFLPLGQLDVEVSYGVGDGRLSPWAMLGDDPVDTGNVLPEPVTNLSVSANSDGSLIAGDWDDSKFATRYLVEVIVEA